MKKIEKSQKLSDVCYDIRGPVLKQAKLLEEEGFTVLKLNTGNPAAFGLNTPDEIVHDIILNIPEAEAYCDSKGVFSARKAIMQYYQERGITDLGIEDIFIGNGVSELISMSMQGLLNQGDEILIPSPDYPLWTAAVTLSGGKSVHYICDESSEWYPDIEDIKNKITPRTRGLVVINPNNPTGSVYPLEILKQLVKIAEENQLILFADEIYEKIVFDGAKHICLNTLTDDVLVVTFNGLSKSYRAAGFRAGWMAITGKKSLAQDYVEGLEILSSMRLCSNVISQFGIQTALGGYQSIDDLVKPEGRLCRQRDVGYEYLSKIPGISCVKPKGALYFFPKIDKEKFNIKSDEQFILDLLKEQKILLVQGSGFNWPDVDHFRIVFLPSEDDLQDAMIRLGDFLSGYKQL
jgi:alanine-synthesizing transaminase